MDRWKLFKDYWRFAVGGAVLMVLLIIWFVPFSQKKKQTGIQWQMQQVNRLKWGRWSPSRR